uniref:BZIP domain-containing protein n=1 Tax=Leersia perrieri TaxID=77586 RepID=A0A0D9WSL7_9ORYZ
MTAVDAEASAAVAAAADIICSLRGADLAGWTPPWGKAVVASKEEEEELAAWPTAARGKRSRSSRRHSPPSGSGSAATKGRWARGSPPSPLDYSGGSGSGASSSGGEDGGFTSPPATTMTTTAAAAAVAPMAVAPTPSPAKVGPSGRRQLILPTPPPRPAGQRPRKKMRLPEIQQLVRTLAVENDGLREEMVALQRACTALSKENCKLETRLEQSSKQNAMKYEGQQARPQPDQHAAKQDSQNGFVLPDLNIPVQDMADGSAP